MDGMGLIHAMTRRQQPLESTETTETSLAGWFSGMLQERIKGKWRAAPATRVQQHMELVETLSLGSKRQVMLIECEGERYMVGCGVDSVATIAKVSPESRRTVKTVAQAWL